MKRDLTALANEQYDLLVIGGGAFGAAAAWDATLRGLKVALVERSDFGSGASAECFKMVHGGIRYLQHADLPRLRFSSAERTAFLRIAPHLVKPLPIVVPTYGYGRNSKQFLSTGMYVYDLLTLGRNRGMRDPSRHIPLTHLLSRREILDQFPELDPKSLTGGAVFHDGQMYNAARLVLAFVRSAANRGAQVANYVEATELLWHGNRVRGARVRDRLGNDTFEIRTGLVLNAAGPWAEYLLDDRTRFKGHRRGPFSRDAYFIVNRQPRGRCALAVPGQSRDSDALFSRAARHLFVVPWRKYTMIGVWHKVFAGRPDTATIDESEIEQWIGEMNTSFPALKLQRDEVIYANCGLVPFGDEASDRSELSFGKETRFFDHRRLHGVESLVTVVGIRFTTARGDAAKALDMLLGQLSKPPRAAATDRVPLLGGDIENFAALRAAATRQAGDTLSAASLDALLRNHGTLFDRVLRMSDTKPHARIGDSTTLGAEVSYAVNQEMAVHLEDVVLRRSDLGSGSHPGLAALDETAQRMQALLGWSSQRRTEEVAATHRTLLRHRATPLMPTTAQLRIVSG
jgi:glycerol-3-phosphate dehydrogenase